jgi:Tetratricopeptide repeat
MGLAELRAAATLHARYQAQASALNLDLSPLAEALSPSAKGFLRRLTAPDSDILDVPSLFRTALPWPSPILGAFTDLDHQTQLEVLVYLAVPVHEYTHHLDMNATPFGCYLQAHMGYELVMFQQFAEAFLRDPETVPTGNIASLGQIFLEGEGRLAEPFRTYWLDLEPYLHIARVWRDFDDLPPKSIELSNKTSDVLHTKFHEVTVDGWWSSYTTEGHQDWFIGPTSILELRGVTASLCWVLDALRGWDRCNEMVGELVAEVYPESAGYDYRFVLDLAAAAGRCTSFAELLRKVPGHLVSFALQIFFRAGWAALHTMTTAITKQAPHVGMAELFLAALRIVERVQSTQADKILATMLDLNPTLESYGLWDVDRILEETASYLERATTLNTIYRKEIREYMLKLTSSSARRLRNRAGHGFIWPPGISAGSTLIPDLAEYAPDLLSPTTVPRQLSEWLSLRRRGFFRPMTSASLRRNIETSLGLIFFRQECICGKLLDLALPPEFGGIQVECPLCHRVWAFPNNFLHGMREREQAGAKTVNLQFQELRPKCSTCGEQLIFVVFKNYVTEVQMTCTRGHKNQYSADQILAAMAAGGIHGRAADKAGAAAQTHRELAEARPDEIPPNQALSPTNLSAGPGDLRRSEEELAATEKTVSINRGLAGSRPNVFWPGLIDSLNSLSNQLADAGRREDALAASQEAVTISRELNEADGGGFRPTLATSLNNLSLRLGDTGRLEDALAASQEATQTYRELAGTRPEAFRPDLAASLTNLSAILTGLGRREDALAASQEATQTYRELAGTRPNSWWPDLAASLNNLSLRLGDTGRLEDALAASQEATQTYRELAGTRPEAFRPDLAASLTNLSAELAGQGRWEDALAAIEEATQTYRELAEAHPDAFRADLAGSLNNLSNQLADAGQRDDALVASQEAVSICRELAEGRPDDFRAVLAGSLTTLSVRLRDLGRREEALGASQEAAQTYRELAEARPEAFRSNLATSLTNLSAILAELRRPEEALAAIDEAVTICRELVEAHPDAFRSDLANSLNNLSNLLADTGQRDDALAAIDEAVTIFRELAAARPNAFRPALARALTNLSSRLSDLGRREEALTASQETTQTYRNLAEAHPDAFRPDLAGSLNHLSNLLADARRPEEALTAIEEATQTFRELAEAQPDAFRADLAVSLTNLAASLGDLGRRKDALAAIKEAVTI